MRKIQTYIGLLGIGIMVAAGFTACTKNTVDPDPSTPPQQSIAELVAADKEFSVLRTAVNKAGLASALGGGTLTLFAPTNAAFAAVGLDSAKVANTDAKALERILQYHVLGTAVQSKDLQAGINKEVTTLAGTAYVSNFVYGEGGLSYGVGINGSRVTFADILATNGVVHKIDALISPASGNIVATLQADPSFSLLVAAAVRANLVTALSGAGPLTVFAPTNDAFVAAGFKDEAAINAAAPATLAKILQYHVKSGRIFSTNFTPSLFTDTQAVKVPGKMAMLSTTDSVAVSSDLKLTGKTNTQAASITRANILTTNGVIHKIDRVLLP